MAENGTIALLLVGLPRSDEHTLLVTPVLALLLDASFVRTILPLLGAYVERAGSHVRSIRVTEHEMTYMRDTYWPSAFAHAAHSLGVAAARRCVRGKSDAHAPP